MICYKCGNDFNAGEIHTIDLSRNPALKSGVMDGSLFVHRCPHCGADNLTPEPVLYHDPEHRLLIAYTSAALSSDGLENYICRRVSSIGDLIEKVKVFDAGLDDVSLELAKYITCQEMHKDVALKFLRIDGADGEIIFTYPYDGKMEMIEVGHNVYSDCQGIVSRNGVMQERSKGLVKVDQEWIRQFLA